MADNQSDLGLIGLAVMGKNLILNFSDHGYSVSCWNRTQEKVEEFIQGDAKGREIAGFHEMDKFIQSLKRPRKIILLIKAGDPVDQVIAECLPHLEEGDILIDGGNSHFPDTERREKELSDKGILYVGCGVSGGELGARHGPSLMPGGNEKAWPEIKKMLQDVSAKAQDGKPCCEWIGRGGSGHYVKMVHNGIEYGDIQLICEAYDFMKRGMKLEEGEMADVFSKENKGVLNSYLVEITSHVLAYKDKDGSYLVTKILDEAGQKGTGRWTGVSALDEGVPLTLIQEAVMARNLSAMKEERVRLSDHFKREVKPVDVKDKDALLKHLSEALYASKIISYAQGFMLMRDAAKHYGWELHFGQIASIWRAGCIIRSVFLDDITKAFEKKEDLENLLFDDFFTKAIEKCLGGWRETVSLGVQSGIPMPAMGSALSFFDGFTSPVLPANLLQALRDYFGAHTYHRVDDKTQSFHTNWTGKGGETSAGSYNA